MKQVIMQYTYRTRLKNKNMEKYSVVFISAELKLTTENAEIKSPQKKPLIQ
jgi:hypothetical protein